MIISKWLFYYKLSKTLTKSCLSKPELKNDYVTHDLVNVKYLRVFSGCLYVLQYNLVRNVKKSWYPKG